MLAAVLHSPRAVQVGRLGRAPDSGRDWALGALVGTLYWVLTLAFFGHNARRAFGILSKTLECTDEEGPAP